MDVLGIMCINNYNIHILKALHGDAFVLKCKKGTICGIVVVDGGPNKDCRKIVEEYDKLGIIDLMVLTHYDFDHIDGILAYINKHKEDKPFPVREIWCNCAYEVPVATSPNISYSHAKKLADLLTGINKDLKNSGYPEVVWQEAIIAGKRIEKPFADFLILSPEEGVKTQNDNQFAKAVANISYNHKRQNDALQKPLKDLAAMPKNAPSVTNTSELVNWSSIAFYLACDNMTVMMLGDSYPQTIVKSLKGFGYNEEKKIEAGYVKVSHHGSRNNISNELLDMIDCNKYIFSTNGGHGMACHPDRETIGNIAYHGNRNCNDEVKLYFNYPQDTIERIGYKFLNSDDVETAKLEAEYNVEYL